MPETPLEEIRRLYYEATEQTIAKDLARAIELLKAMPTEEERGKAAVYMEGLAEMRTEWRDAARRQRPAGSRRRRNPRRT